MAKPNEDLEVIEQRKVRAKDKEPRHVDVTPAVKLDMAVLQPGIEAQIDDFIADREAAELPLPDREAMLARARHLLDNVDPTKLVGMNSLGRNKSLTLHHSDTEPYFKMGTTGDRE